jgi:hypothetical protein
MINFKMTKERKKAFLAKIDQMELDRDKADKKIKKSLENFDKKMQARWNFLNE